MLLIGFCSCNHNKKMKQGFNENVANSVEKPIFKEQYCDADFDVFFKKFQADSVFQRKHIKFPLKTTFLNLEGDLSVMREDIPEDKYSFSIFKNDKEIGDTGNGLYEANILKEKDSAYYQINGIDNGIGTKVTFAFIDGCWYMIAVEDTST
jgi:hypothetical protein